MTHRYSLHTGPNGLTATAHETRLPRPISPKSQRLPKGFTVERWHGWGAIFDGGRLVAVVESEGEAEQILREGERWKRQQQQRNGTAKQQRCSA